MIQVFDFMVEGITEESFVELEKLANKLELDFDFNKYKV